ncbi:MAG: hypothetical protein MI749_22190, partial [Desulfovibrionales bacterium]|nr:hypothetical protein [Desulfovibrionales bacterium]
LKHKSLALDSSQLVYGMTYRVWDSFPCHCCPYRSSLILGGLELLAILLDPPNAHVKISA